MLSTQLFYNVVLELSRRNTLPGRQCNVLGVWSINPALLAASERTNEMPNTAITSSNFWKGGAGEGEREARECCSVFQTTDRGAKIFVHLKVVARPASMAAKSTGTLPAAEKYVEQTNEQLLL